MNASGTEPKGLVLVVGEEGPKGRFGHGPVHEEELAPGLVHEGAARWGRLRMD